MRMGMEMGCFQLAFLGNDELEFPNLEDRVAFGSTT